MWSKAVISKLDRWWPPIGVCAFCGHRDARHRIWDAILSRHSAGDKPADIAKDYDMPLAAIRAVLTIRPYKKNRRTDDGK